MNNFFLQFHCQTFMNIIENNYKETKVKENCGHFLFQVKIKISFDLFKNNF